MSFNVETEIISLGKTCERISAEVIGMQRLMEEMAANQKTLIGLVERADGLEKNLSKADKALETYFERLRRIEGQRLEPRIENLENSSKWLRVSVFGTLSSGAVGGFVLWLRKVFMD